MPAPIPLFTTPNNKKSRWLMPTAFRYLVISDYSSINSSNILIEDFAIGVPGPKIAAAPS